jgi:hypothetical protein
MKQFPETKFKMTGFNEYEDFEYPIAKLIEGFHLLEDTKGNMERFAEFANKNRMPKKDRARIIDKYKYAFKAEFQANKIGKTI